MDTIHCVYQTRMSGRRHDAESTEIRIEETDAEPGHWPAFHEEIISNEDGFVDCLVRASKEKSKDWRKKIANYLFFMDNPEIESMSSVTVIFLLILTRSWVYSQ